MKFIIVVFFSALFTLTLNAKCIDGNCVNGEGIETYDDFIYIGNFKNGKKDGDGTLREGKDSFYVLYNGKFKNDKPYGQGIMYIHDNNYEPCIIGDFIDFKIIRPGTALLMKQNHNSVDAYYIAEEPKNGSQGYKFSESKTADLFCSNNPLNILCAVKFMDQNKKSIATIMGLGYLKAVVGTSSSMSLNSLKTNSIKFKHIKNALNTLGRYMTKNKNESLKNFVKRMNDKIIQAKQRINHKLANP